MSSATDVIQMSMWVNGRALMLQMRWIGRELEGCRLKKIISVSFGTSQKGVNHKAGSLEKRRRRAQPWRPRLSCGNDENDQKENWDLFSCHLFAAGDVHVYIHVTFLSAELFSGSVANCGEMWRCEVLNLNLCTWILVVGVVQRITYSTRSDRRHVTGDTKPQTADRRPQTADRRQQTGHTRQV